MLSIKDKGILLKITKYCERIENKMTDVTQEDLNFNEDLQEIVCFNILQIGEAAKKLSNDFIKENDKVAWKSIKGMRDILVHAYGSIDIVTIWKTSKQDIAPLKNYCEEILDKDIKKHEQD